MATEINDSKQCPVCFEDYTETGDYTPLILPCSHTLCKKCKVDMIARNPKGKLKCPLDSTNYPGKRVFPENRYIIENIRERGQKRKRDEFAFSRCKKHPRRDLDLSCQKCKLDVCDLCMNKDHVGHEVVDLNDLMDEKLATVKNKEEQVQKMKRKLLQQKSMAEKQGTNTLKEFETQKKNKITEIEDNFRHMTAKLTAGNKASSQLFEKMEANVDECLDKADIVKEDKSSITYEDLQRAEKCLDRFLTNGLASSAYGYFEIISDWTFQASLGIKLKEREERLDIGPTCRGVVTRSIVTNLGSLWDLVVAGSTAIAVGRESFKTCLKKFNLDTGDELHSVIQDAGFSALKLAKVQLAGQDCVAVSDNRISKQIEFRDWNNPNITVATYYVDHNPRVCTGSSSELLSWDVGNNRVHWLDCSTNPPKPAVSKGSIPVPKRPDDMLLVRSAGKQLVCTNPEGVTSYNTESGKVVWKQKGRQREMLEPETGVTTDHKDHLFLCDTGNACVQKFRMSDGKYLGAVVRKGEQGIGIPHTIAWFEASASLLVGHCKNKRNEGPFTISIIRP